jgi:hypothetical protein
MVMIRSNILLINFTIQAINLAAKNHLFTHPILIILPTKALFLFILFPRIHCVHPNTG